MKLRYFLAALSITALFQSPVMAQETDDDTTDTDVTAPLPPKKFYVGNSLDAAIFSTSLLTSPLSNNSLSTLRFSYWFNFGFTFNYDPGKHFGLLSGVGIKNIGFIEKTTIGDSTIKRRVYAIGVPLGIKFGNLNKRNFGFIGGGLDVPFNYREKGFVKRGDKTKFNEWFSDRTNLLLPYVFAGFSINPGLTFKVQYYPGNFMNTSYTSTYNLNGIPLSYRPYRNYDVQLLMLCLGMDIHYNRTPKVKDLKNVKKMM